MSSRLTNFPTSRHIRRDHRPGMVGFECPYCGGALDQTTGAEVYPDRKRQHDPLQDRVIYICYSCEAWVGTHKGTLDPLGFPANQELRALRAKVHKYFDLHWNTFPRKQQRQKRREAYEMLGEALGIRDVHIAMLGHEDAKKALTFLASKRFSVSGPGIDFEEG